MRSQYLVFEVEAQDGPRVGLRRTDGIAAPAGDPVAAGAAGDVFVSLLPRLTDTELFELGRLVWEVVEARLRGFVPPAGSEPPTRRIPPEEVEAARAAAAEAVRAPAVWEDEGGRTSEAHTFPPGAWDEGDEAATVFG